MLTHLFSPMTVGSLTLKNRAVMPAMGTGYGNADSTVNERLITYLERRARGGTGLIITEICAVDPRGKGFVNEIGVWDDHFIPGLSRLANRLHAAGAACALQLHHAGRETFAAACNGVPEAPSPLPSPVLNQQCTQMDEARIIEIIEAYATGAERARRAGFDAVEIHAAHGYLPGQFLSPLANVRTDRWGGSEENRFRFLLEILRAVRAATGPDFPILVRISAEELVSGGYDLDCARRLAPLLETAGADALHCSVGVYATPGGYSIACMDTPHGFNLERARALKQELNIPVIAVGRITDPRLADEAIGRGDADLVSFGRQHLCDPDFLDKASRGDFERIRFCIGCNQGCVERLMLEFRTATCSINPDCGQETRNNRDATRRPRHVWVIGAGPAGLSAALQAAACGHRVEIFESQPHAGGQLDPASRPPHKDSFATWTDWCLRELKNAGVPLHYNSPITADILTEMRPESVILATGAHPAHPRIPGIQAPHVVDARAILTGEVPPRQPAVILGAGYVGLETADFLLARDCPVTLLEMQTTLPVGNFTAHGYWLLRRTRKARLVLGATVTAIDEDQVRYHSADEEQQEPAAQVILALGARSEDSLAEVIATLDIPCEVVGDAREPRRLLEAVHEGHLAAARI